MLRIGEAAKSFNISNRTLRYWEEAGILKSIRMENGYRFYDDENAVRIRQIVLLRKLNMPVSDIERIFIAGEFNVAIDTLTEHLARLKRDAAAYDALIMLVDEFIRQVKGLRSLKQVFSYLETQTPIEIPAYENDNKPQIKLSERVMTVSDKQLNNVRIVKLPAMTVASYRAVSENPEYDCSLVFNDFVLKNNLHKRSGYRQFGFNNPSPSENNPVYGYEMWVTIPEDIDVPSPLIKKQFDGGLYASISTYMNEIGERWQLLYQWCKNNDKYDVDFSFQWLEECSMDFEMFISDEVPGSEKQLDLLEPIKLR